MSKNIYWMYICRFCTHGTKYTQYSFNVLISPTQHFVSNMCIYLFKLDIWFHTVVKSRYRDIGLYYKLTSFTLLML